MGNTISAYHVTTHEVKMGPRGIIRGVQFENKARRYAGIPYALPPTGECRWRKPRPLPESYTYSQLKGTPFDATYFRPVCPQKAFHASGQEEEDSEKYSEDCLVVNIWTPVEKSDHRQGQKWPVFLWLHGGWFQMGDPSQELSMDPTEMISTGKLDAIVIAIGYRLNIFGFLATEALHSESEGESAGNFGLWDQRLAMEWIQDNIGAFNGDPENITLAGRSAGAYSVYVQLLHDLRTGSACQLYHRIFMCSNAIPAQPKSLSEVEAQFDEVCEYFGVSSTLSTTAKLAELRKISSRDLIEALGQLQHHTFRPVTDGLFIHSGMVEYQRSAAFANEFRRRGLRILIGEVLNEETLYSIYNAPEPNLESLRLQLINYYGPATTSRLLRHYLLPETSREEDWTTVFGIIVADGQVRVPSRSLVNSLSTHGVKLYDIWRYQIAYPSLPRKLPQNRLG
jgi:carboxylesterase type B